jgi:hypothetical protein
VKAALDNPTEQFERGPRVVDMRRVVKQTEGAAFVVEDGRYVSGRWPADAHLFAERFIDKLSLRAQSARTAHA